MEYDFKKANPVIRLEDFKKLKSSTSDSKDLHEKLLKSSAFLQSDYPFYGEMLLKFSYHETDRIPTAGVNATKDFRFNFYYNSDFLNYLNQRECNFVIVHEIFHILFNHPTRIGERNHTISNIAQDMIINNIINRDLVNKYPNHFSFPYNENNEQMGFIVPAEYKGKHIYEHLYDWLLDLQQNPEKYGINPEDIDKEIGNENGNESENQSGNQSGNESGNQSGNESGNQSENQSGNQSGNESGNQSGNESGNQSGNESGNDKSEGKSGNPTDIKDVYKAIRKDDGGNSLDVHIQDEISPELKKQMVDNLIEEMKARGLVKGDIDTQIKELRKSKKNYLKEIKKELERIIGRNKSRTWSKPNRKGLPFRGFRKYNTKINVLLDTSGSMDEYFEKVFSYIFQNDISINLIQCDTEVRATEKITNKNDLKKIRIKGLGGTIIQPGIDYISEKYNKYPTVILTDGYTDTLNLRNLKKRVLILTIDDECPISDGKNKVKQIVIKNEN